VRSPTAGAEFRRELGLLDATFIVAGGIIGVGIFANPANVARVLHEPGLILLAWAVGGVVALVGGFVWAELASRFPHTGGQYVYLVKGWHPAVGFLYGVALLFIINGGGLAAVAIVFASYLDRAFVPLGPRGVQVAAASALVALTAINAVGVRTGKWTNNLLMLAKVGGMVALLALAFGRGVPPASQFTMPSRALDLQGLHLLFTALVPILFAYGGWQSCASVAGEIERPERNLAWANVLGVVLVVTLYLLLNLAYLWVLPASGVAASTALAADVARAAAGEIGARFVSALIVASSLGFLAVVIMTGPRLCYAMACDGLFFRRAARLHPRHGTPVFALWFQTAVALLLLATNTFDELLSYVVFADWLFFGLTAGALIRARRRDPSPPHVFRAPGHPVTTWGFVVVAAGVVLNCLVAYPAQSMAGCAILAVAAVAYALLPASRPSAR
jgi:APA family basic amino acid/polyamine antiporter